MEELEKGLKELKEFATHRKNNNINQLDPPEGPMTIAAYVAENGLIW